MSAHPISLRWAGLKSDVGSTSSVSRCHLCVDMDPPPTPPSEKGRTWLSGDWLVCVCVCAAVYCSVLQCVAPRC